MNNNEKFTRLRRLFTEYEALKSEKNLRIYDIQKLSIPGGLKENYIKEYKAVVDPKLGKVEDDIMKILDDKAVTCVLNREDAIRYCSEKRDDILRFDGPCLDGEQMIKRGDIEEAIRICGCGPCNLRTCPLREVRGCTRITRMYRDGEYDRVIKIKEE